MSSSLPSPMLRAPPSTPIKLTDLSSSSIDDALAKATNESLSMGASIVKDIDNISFVLPPRHKLHLGLYINTSASKKMMEDNSTTAVTTSLLNCSLASMQLNHNRADSEEQKPPTNSSRVITADIRTSNAGGGENTVNGGGVPGFPDFPDCWDGSTPSTPKASNRKLHYHTNRFSNSNGTQKRHCHRRIHRTAVNNIPHGSPSSRAVVSLSPGRDTMKRCARDERKLRRLAKVIQLKERQRRKKDMGDICRGMAAIKW